MSDQSLSPSQAGGVGPASYNQGAPSGPPQGYGAPGQPGPAPGGYGQPPAPVDRSRLRPGRGGYVLAAAVLVIGWVLAGVLFFLTLSDATGGIETFSSPGTQSVQVTEIGSYTIYGNAADQASAQCTATGPAGDELTLQSNVGTTVTLGGQTYASTLRFDADTSGTYRIDCTGTDTVRLAVGPGFAIGGFVGSVLGVVALALLTPLLAFVIWLVTLLRRNRSAARMRQGLPN